MASGAASLACGAWTVSPARAWTDKFTPPTTVQSFSSAIAGMKIVKFVSFGTRPERSVRTLRQLAAQFEPYGIAGMNVIHEEWERYQPFNTTNFVMTDDTLDITATIPPGGGLFPGGINSGQIWTRQTFLPCASGSCVYAFDIRMRVPGTPGMWSAAWFYSKGWGFRDGSEIDNPEFMVSKWQTSKDWTAFDHGPGQGVTTFSRRTNQWTWHPGIDFASVFHDYQMIWTPLATYKYVDGLLVDVQAFKWTSAEPAQLGVNLAVGTWMVPGLQPVSMSQFPAKLSVEHITVWAK